MTTQEKLKHVDAYLAEGRIEPHWREMILEYRDILKAQMVASEATGTPKRLTIDTSIPFCDIAKCASYQGGPYCQDGKCDQRKVYEKLREYERTGLAPGQVAELAAKAKQTRRKN